MNEPESKVIYVEKKSNDGCLNDGCVKALIVCTCLFILSPLILLAVGGFGVVGLTGLLSFASVDQELQKEKKLKDTIEIRKAVSKRIQDGLYYPSSYTPVDWDEYEMPDGTLRIKHTYQARSQKEHMDKYEETFFMSKDSVIMRAWEYGTQPLSIEERFKLLQQAAKESRTPIAPNFNDAYRNDYGGIESNDAIAAENRRLGSPLSRHWKDLSTNAIVHGVLTEWSDGVVVVLADSGEKHWIRMVDLEFSERTEARRWEALKKDSIAMPEPSEAPPEELGEADSMVELPSESIVQPAPEVREWTNAQTGKKLSASLVWWNAKEICVAQDETERTFPLTMFTAEDIDYVRKFYFLYRSEP
jgi:hypothetical protein